METNEDHRFNKIFWYVTLTTSSVIAYVVAVTFIAIPAGNQHNVDLSLGFLLGTLLGGGVAYLLGGSPSTAKKPSDTTTTANITADITTTPTEDK